MAEFIQKSIIAFLFIFSICIHRAGSQTGHRIQFNLENYADSQVVVGYYFGENTLIYDTLYSQNHSEFVLEGSDTLKSGIYLLLTFPDKEFFQFMVNQNDQHFALHTDVNELGSVICEGSIDNEIFYEYLNFLKEKREQVEQINVTYQNALPGSEEEESKNEALKKLDREVRAKQEKIIIEHPDLTVSLLLKGNMPPAIPDFEGTADEKKLLDFHYYKEHYFDNIDFDNPASLYTPFFYNKINDYISKFTVQVPDSINQSIDYVLSRMEGNEEAYRYFLSHFLNTYAQSKIVGFDAVYVHLAVNYYGAGKAAWVEEENLQKIVDNALRLRPTLIGKQAPDFTVFMEDSSSLSLHSIDSKYIVLFFWAPDCGHCEKAIPRLKEFYEQFKDRGVAILTICNKTGDKYNSCWEGVRSKGIEAFINTGDQHQKSRILTKYYVRNTPKIFILNEDKQIIMKNIGAEQLSEVMEELIKAEENKKDSAGAVH